jgi:serum/glucocorticoid-regulated kinase 2
MVDPIVNIESLPVNDYIGYQSEPKNVELL